MARDWGVVDDEAEGVGLTEEDEGEVDGEGVLPLLSSLIMSEARSA